ncbi:hypothetical protein [Rhodococcus sp. CH91]|uniref:hypothetical protein n=1 Tax=Rhodococcus sp. CH91 TaxID=2910256 RepID=UPI001F4A4E3A|nr:hypothetical protein [Rhodococcus sp. CH91]
MRPMLGISLDDGEVCAVLVDADVPALGPFDSQRGFGAPGADPADAAAAAATVMAERAASASLNLVAAAVVTGQENDQDAEPVAEAVRAVLGLDVDVVVLDDARLAFLAGAPELSDLPVLALHTRTFGVESASVVDVPSRTVLSTVSPEGDEFGPHTQSLPEAMDEAIARAGTSPAAVVFLDLRPGDAAPARELSTVLGVPFVTPHGVPWHRATGAALVAAERRVPPVAAAPAGRRRGTVLLATLVLLVALLGGGLAVAVGGGTQPGRSAPGLQTAVAPPPSPVPQPDRPLVEDPCSDVRPASWPARASDPDAGQVPSPEETVPAAPPCEGTPPSTP